MNNNLMDEIDNIERIEEFQNDNFEMTTELINPELQKIIDEQRKLGEFLALLTNYTPTPEINQKIQECENKIIELEDLIEIMNSLGPGATINQAIQIKKEKEAEQKNSVGMDKPKQLILSNPNVPSVLPDEKNNEHHQDSFFKPFIYTAIICGALMSAYITILF